MESAAVGGGRVRDEGTTTVARGKNLLIGSFVLVDSTKSSAPGSDVKWSWRGSCSGRNDSLRDREWSNSTNNGSFDRVSSLKKYLSPPDRFTPSTSWIRGASPVFSTVR